MGSSTSDPSGYFALREEVASYSARLREVGELAAATELEDALGCVGLASEWLGELAYALRRALASGSIPDDLSDAMARSLDEVREGFRRVGTEPKF